MASTSQFFGSRADNQPVGIIAAAMSSDVNDDDEHSSSSSTQAPEGYEEHVIQETQEGGAILPSPVRVSSTRYPFQPTPERQHSRLQFLSRVSAAARSSTAAASRDSSATTGASAGTRNTTAANASAAASRVSGGASAVTARTTTTTSARGSSSMAAASRDSGGTSAAASSLRNSVNATARSRGGVKNYSNDELSSLLECIRRVLPIGNDQWELVAELHGI